MDSPRSSITRAHLEEDTARLQHTRDGDRAVSLLDYDRSGVPLLEIVTDPVIHDAETARRYAEELRLLLVTVGASDAAMESGQMRVEANVSLRPAGTEPFGTRVEVKNMNSFRSVERAIEFEIARQEAALRAGEPLIQETRGWDDDRGVTYHMRTKETSDDYRYFPEPDLPPLRVEPAWLEQIAAGLPELPAARRARYHHELGLSAYDADVLVADAAASAVFEAARAADPELPVKKLANWVTGEYLRLAKSEDADVDVAHISGEQLAALVRLVEDGEISGTNAKEVLLRVGREGRPVAEVVAASGFKQISDHRCPAGRGRRGHRPEPRRGRRHPRRREEGHRLPHRSDHEEDARPGQRRSRAAAHPREPGGRVGEMDVLSLVLIAGGIVAVIVGALQMRGPLAVIRRLDETQANLARYETWRGKRTGPQADGPTGADEMRAQMRQRLLLWGVVAGAGVVSVFVGLLAA